ncbi:MAG TPA: hypothetical protein VF338_11745, partial [Leptolinea sp.]
QIYQSGLAAGNDPSRFSKVGDCQSIKDVLLGPYDKPLGYFLRENAEALTETIHQFAGSFDRDGEAVQGGFNAASELTPLMSNPDVCEPGETPMECEVRVHNPSIVLISLEVWWDGRSPALYNKDMRQIIDYFLIKGILPILSTKADNVEGDNAINLETARLAYEYDLPLWNWWKAAQTLPNHGLDLNRPDGFHISQEFAWPERSFTALQALDAVWRGVRISDGTATVQPASPTEVTQSAFNLLQPTLSGNTLQVTPTGENSAACSVNPASNSACPIPNPLGTTLPPSSPAVENGTLEPAAINPAIPAIDPIVGANPLGFILLSTARRIGESVVPQGIYLVDSASGTAVRIAPEGTSLQAVAPNGKQILFSRGSDLWLAAMDGSQPVALTNHFYNRNSTSAAWRPDGKSIVFLAEQDGHSLLVQYPLDGTAGWKRLSPAGENPIEIFPSADPSRIFWENGTCPAAGATGSCTSTGIYASGLDGSSTEVLPGSLKAAFSSDGHWLAFEDRTKDDKSQLIMATTDLVNRRTLENIGDHLLDFSWSPDGTKLSLLALERSDYSGKWLDIRNLVITTQDMGTKILPATSGVNPRAVWSPDGSSLLLTGTQETEGGYTIQLQVMDTVSGSIRDLTGAAGFKDNEFIYTTRIYWVKT